MGVLDCLPKLKRVLELAFDAHFLHDLIILYPLTKLQCCTFFPTQDVKQNVLLSSYLDN